MTAINTHGTGIQIEDTAANLPVRNRRPAPAAQPAGPTLAGAYALAGEHIKVAGIITGWQGSGEMTRGSIVAALESAGMPSSDAPRAKSAKRCASMAISACTTAQDGVTGDRRGSWSIGRKVAGDVGESLGQITVTVRLREDDTLAIAGDEILGVQISTEYARRLHGEVLSATEITHWFTDLVRSRFSAVSFGGVWFVPSASVTAYQSLRGALQAAGYGSQWLPGLTVHTEESLAVGLRDGLSAEVATLAREVAQARRVARDGGRGDIGPRAAHSWLEQVEALAGRIESFGYLVGAGHVLGLHTDLHQIRRDLADLTSDTALRGIHLELR